MTSQITFSDFGVGKDLRKAPSVAEPNRLRQLKNAFITKGKAIKKRPPFDLVTTLESGSTGLVSAKGVLNTFYEGSTVSHAHSLFTANQVDHGSTVTDVSKIHFSDVYDGYIYVSVEYANGDIKHHYLDGSTPTRITDANCPNSKGVIKMEEKFFAIGTDVVDFCATANPRDWTTSDDAGFIATGRQQRGQESPIGLGQFQKSGLVVFHSDGAQLWNVDPNPQLMVYQQPLSGSQTRYHRAIAPLFTDLFFLSDTGFRSISESIVSDGQQEIDVGSPIDSEIVALLTGSEDPISLFWQKAGQFWCFIGSSAYVYTFSRTAKISAWSVYTLPWTVTAADVLDGELYVREGDNVYKANRKATDYRDNGTSYELEAQLAYVDVLKPGINKYWQGVDAVFSAGSGAVSFRYNPNDETLETSAQTLSGDTAPGTMTAIEVTSPSISAVIKDSSQNDFQIDELTLYYNELTAT